MMCLVVYSVRSRGHSMLFLGQWTKLIRAVMRDTPVNPEEESGPSELLDEERPRADAMGHFSSLGKVIQPESRVIFLPCVSQGRVCYHQRSLWDLAPPSGRLAFTLIPEIEIGDTRLALVSFQMQPSKWRRDRARVWSNCDDSFLGPWLGVTFYRKVSTILVLWTLILLWWRKPLLSLMFCDWVEATKLLINFGHIWFVFWVDERGCNMMTWCWVCSVYFYSVMFT